MTFTKLKILPENDDKSSIAALWHVVASIFSTLSSRESANCL